MGQIAIATAALVAVWALGDVIMLVFFSILLAASLRGAAGWVGARTHLRPTLSLALVVIAAAVALLALFYWAGPNLYAQLTDLTHRLVTETSGIRHRLQAGGYIGSGSQLQALAERAVSPLTTLFAVSLTTLTESLVAIVTAIYFAAAPRLYVDGIIRLAPIRHRARLHEVAAAVTHVLRMWVLGQFISMGAVGVLASVGLWLAGVPAPFALGLISGLFTFVPYIGTLVSGTIAVLIALSAGLATAAWALGVFILCHLVEGYVIAPMVQRRILEMPPALSVLSMTVLGTLFGIPGIVLGTPLAAAAVVVIQSLYVGDVLGDHTTDPTRQ